MSDNSVLALIESNTDTDLEHFGVKGMKWGVRKDNRGSSRAARVVETSKSKNPNGGVDWTVKDAKTGRTVHLKTNRDGADVKAKVEAKAREHIEKRLEEPVAKASPVEKRKAISELSDDELRTAINRIKMEKEYAQLVAEHRGKPKNSAVKQILANSAKTAAQNALSKQGEAVLTTALTMATKQAAKEASKLKK